MTNQLIELKFQDHQIRSIIDDQGNPWFVAKDVFAALEIAWKRSDSLKQIPKTWIKGAGDTGPLCNVKGAGKFPTPGGEQELIFINEPAVYMIAFRSNKPNAILFTEWVAGEVLPTIRKTGKYALPALQKPQMPKGGFGSLPDYFSGGDAGDEFALLSLHELGIELNKPVPQWIRDELTLKTRWEVYQLAKSGSKLAKHFIESLYGLDVENPQLSF
jgi:prophage antirepressor-like protein